MEANVSRIYILHRLRSKRSHRNATFLHGQTYLAGTPYSTFPFGHFSVILHSRNTADSIRLTGQKQYRMGKEIEKKFTVISDSYKANAAAYDIAQGYICTDENRVVRVRLKNGRAFLTVKNATIGYSRDEFEYEIPADDARVMLERVCIQPVISKRRYVTEHTGHVWEVDEFHGENEGLVIAEIELDDEDEPFSLPPFVGMEVTGNPLYYNARLFSHPFCRWSAEEKSEHAKKRG